MTKLLTPTSIEKTVYGEHGTAINEIDARSGLDWIYVGTYIDEDDPGNDPFTTEDSPPFQNGWANVGDTLSPLRFAWNRDGNVDIVGSIAGGTNGSVVFTMIDDLYIPDYEERLSGNDDFSNLVVWRIMPDGTVILGLS